MQQQDLFGGDSTPSTKKKGEKNIPQRKKGVELTENRIDISELGLNACWENFAQALKDRSNKTQTK